MGSNQQISHWTIALGIAISSGDPGSRMKRDAMLGNLTLVRGSTTTVFFLECRDEEVQ